MLTETEAVVLRQVKTPNGKRILTMFTKKYGKISVGSNQTEGGKQKSALLTRPFTYGKYEIYKNRESYNLSSGQVLKSYYEIGEDLDAYQSASFVLELTDKLLSEGDANPKLFVCLQDFFEVLSQRKKSHDTIVLAYMVKAMDILGAFPELEKCSSCGNAADGEHFSIRDGGMICSDCAAKHLLNPVESKLIYTTNFGIVDILRYFKKEPFKKFEKLALDEDIEKELMTILKEYLRFHFEIGILKSEELQF